MTKKNQDELGDKLRALATLIVDTATGEEGELIPLDTRIAALKVAGMFYIATTKVKGKIPADDEDDRKVVSFDKLKSVIKGTN